MDSEIAQLMKSRPYRPFMPLFFSLAGWALLQAWVHLIGANFRAHILVAVPGLVLTVWSAFPFSRSRHISAETENRPAKQSRRAVLAGALLLLAAGAALGSLTARGSVFLLGIAGMAFCFIPWARLPFVQRHPAVPCAAASFGFASAILIAHQSIEVMFLPLATWVFWLCACAGLILRAENSLRVERETAAKGAAMEAERRPATCES